MAMLLSSIQRGRIVRPRRTLVYGVHGVGKSTFGSMAPAPIFLPTEEGANDIDVDKFPIAQRLEDVFEAIGELYQSDHAYRTLVVDSADWLEKLVHIKTCQEHNVQTIDEIEYGKGYTFAMRFWREVVSGFDALRTKREMSIVIIAHSTVEKFADPASEPYDRYTPALRKESRAYLQEWCDEVFFATYETFVRKVKAGYKETAVAVGGARVLRCVEAPSHLAKNRLNMPATIPLDYAEYATFLAGDTPRQPDPQPEPEPAQAAE